MDNIFNDETLKLARTYLGLNQKDFADKVGVSQAQISSIEKSHKPLTKEIASKLTNEFGDTFFSQKMSFPNLKVHYRASATIAKKYTDLFESRLYLISNIINELLNLVNIPENQLPKIDLEDFQLDTEYVANEVREFFHLGKRPIDDIVSLLENKGVILYFFDYDFISAQNKNFDGVSFYVSGVPVILINNKIQNARKVFTIAHELCHLIAHNHGDFIISNDRDIEKEANVFASEFIAPKSALRGEFSFLTMEKLFLLKSHWKMSVAALIYKAKDMVLTKDQYRRWITRLARYRKVEPNDFSISNPIILIKIFEVSINELGNEEDFYKEIGISKSMFEEVFSTIIEQKKSKLRIII